MQRPKGKDLMGTFRAKSSLQLAAGKKMEPQSYSHKEMNSANNPLGLEEGPEHQKRMLHDNHFHCNFLRPWEKDPMKLCPDSYPTETVRQYMYIALYCLVLGNFCSHKKLIQALTLRVISSSYL